MFIYFYCYVYVFLLFYSVLGILFHCVVLCTVCVNVYCTTATGCQPNCSKRNISIYIIIFSSHLKPKVYVYLGINCD
jgi:hypothetical protein